jgi:hypothetical protein
MAFLVLGANSVSGYTVKNSLRFNSGSSDYLSRTFGSAGNQKTMTFSFWVKRSNLSSGTDVISQGSGSACHINFDGSNQIEMNLRNSVDGASNVFLITSQLFRDVSAWYHIVLALDTTQATNTNRVKLYVNGTQVTAFGTTTYPSQNGNLFFNEASAINIGRSVSTGSHYNGYMSDVFFIDGQALTPSSFGETDEDTGIWKPKAYTGTYGTNGFYLQFKNSASLGTDSSGNGNTFTVNNLTSVDQSTDTPTNNFCTWNPLDNFYNGSTFSEGNNRVVTGASTYTYNTGTIGVSKGKWYWEVKATATTSGSASWYCIGASSIISTSGTSELGYSLYTFSYIGDNGTVRINGTTVATLSTYTTGAIISIALDLDNNLVYFYKNGTIQNSGTGISITASSSTPIGFWLPAVGDYDGASTYTFDCNFGNPPYSANSYQDANGFGNFSYSVPSGFYSLNTKNLANFGF